MRIDQLVLPTQVGTADLLEIQTNPSVSFPTIGAAPQRAANRYASDGKVLSKLKLGPGILGEGQISRDVTFAFTISLRTRDGNARDSSANCSYGDASRTSFDAEAKVKDGIYGTIPAGR